MTFLTSPKFLRLPSRYVFKKTQSYFHSSDHSGGGFAAEKQLVPEVPPLFYKNSSNLKDASVGAMSFAGTWRRKASMKGLAPGAQNPNMSIGSIATLGRKKVAMPKKPPRKPNPEDTENPDFKFSTLPPLPGKYLYVFLI